MPRAGFTIPNDAKELTHWHDIQPVLDAGYEFKFHSMAQGWYCVAANVTIKCHTYDMLKRSFLIKQGKKWSPTMQADERTRVADEAAKNQEKRLDYWYEQITEAMEAGGTRRERIDNIVKEIWSQAGAISITDPM